MDRRNFGGTLLGGAMTVVVGFRARAQSSDELAADAARTFITDMMAEASRNDLEAMDAFLRDRVDTEYAFQVAFAPVDGIMSQDQRERLASVMLRFLARETLMVAGMAQGGGFTLSGTERVEGGTLVEGVFRDAAGDYPFNVLVGAESTAAHQLILDFGSPRESSVVTRLAYATTSLAQVSPDAEVWIKAFEQAVGS